MMPPPPPQKHHRRKILGPREYVYLFLLSPWLNYNEQQLIRRQNNTGTKVITFYKPQTCYFLPPLFLIKIDQFFFILMCLFTETFSLICSLHLISSFSGQNFPILHNILCPNRYNQHWLLWFKWYFCLCPGRFLCSEEAPTCVFTAAVCCCRKTKQIMKGWAELYHTWT